MDASFRGNITQAVNCSAQSLARYEADVETTLVEVVRLYHRRGERLNDAPELQVQLSAAPEGSVSLNRYSGD